MGGRLPGVPAGVSSLVGASGSAGAGEAAGQAADALQPGAYAESLGGDAVSLVCIALVGVIAISRRRKTR